MKDGPMGSRALPDRVPIERWRDLDKRTHDDCRIAAIGSLAARNVEPAGLLRRRAGETYLMFNHMKINVGNFSHRAEAREFPAGAIETHQILNVLKLGTLDFTLSRKAPDERIDVSASMALATMAAGWVYAGSANWRFKAQRRWAMVDRWQVV
jgi:hypothetical protein